MLSRLLLYARKSSESEDRQVQSIEDQISRLKRVADDPRNEIEIVDILTESFSAKKPNNRPVFEKLLQRLEDGEADGILCWGINRLSRNPIDSGKISWMLQQGIIKVIQTVDRQYRPEDNILLFSIESSQANQDIRELSKGVTRGMEGKRERGWFPHLAPIGYLNDRLERTIIEDPERFALIRKIWDLMLTGGYTPPKILDMANNDWGLRTRKHKKIGGKELSRSLIYKILTNIFYTGVIAQDDKQYKGKHKPMITLDEFDRVQMLLGRKGKPRPQKHEFAFTGFIRCGECGCLCTALTKKKYIKSTGKIQEYTYYYCTRKKKNIVCSQRKSIKEQDLEGQISDELKKYEILPEFRDWALEVLRENNDLEIEDRAKIYESQHRALTETQTQLDNLTRMRYRDLIDDDAFIRERNILQNSITQMKVQLRETESRAEEWIELTERTFNFATYARINFAKGDLQIKKEILMALGQNPILKDGRLSLLVNEWFVEIEKDYPALEKQYLALEPLKEPTEADKKTLAAIRLRWCTRRESNPRPFVPKTNALSPELLVRVVDGTA